MGQSSLFELLPVELKIKILSFCDPVSVLNVAATGPVFRELVVRNEENISRAIVCQNINPDLRCLAAARHRAEYHGFPIARHQSGERRSVGAARLCNLFLYGGDGLIDDHVFEGQKKQGLYGNFKFSLKVAYELVSFHRTVQEFASILSESAVHKGPLSTVEFSGIDIPPMAPDWVRQVSPTELSRFEKALYLFDLATVILPYMETFDFDDPDHNTWYAFWVCFPPWEHHQVRCIQQMLQDWVDDRKLNPRNKYHDIGC
ncbi:hypothetical protein F5B19DRAFT_479653 [Rostrohypoxylon terebratum]|nr:hypothetical protein F5B19DRAFT_479653 [Rostrohypoxylon terebratum]